MELTNTWISQIRKVLRADILPNTSRWMLPQYKRPSIRVECRKETFDFYYTPDATMFIDARRKARNNVRLSMFLAFIIRRNEGFPKKREPVWLNFYTLSISNVVKTRITIYDGVQFCSTANQSSQLNNDGNDLLFHVAQLFLRLVLNLIDTNNFIFW